MADEFQGMAVPEGDPDGLARTATGFSQVVAATPQSASVPSASASASASAIAPVALPARLSTWPPSEKRSPASA